MGALYAVALVVLVATPLHRQYVFEPARPVITLY